MDWFDLGTTTENGIVDLELAQPVSRDCNGESPADLDMELWCGGALCTGAYGYGSATSLRFAPGECCAPDSPLALWVFTTDPSPSAGTAYSITRF